MRLGSRCARSTLAAVARAALPGPEPRRCARQETGFDEELNTLTVSADIREFDVLPTQPRTQFDPFPHTEPPAAHPSVSRDFAAKPHSVRRKPGSVMCAGHGRPPMQERDGAGARRRRLAGAADVTFAERRADGIFGDKAPLSTRT